MPTPSKPRSRIGARLLTVALLAGPIAALPVADASETGVRNGSAGGGEPSMQAMAASPGMAELMEALGPNAICPRGACGFGRDGIPEPYTGGGIRGARATAPAADGLFPARRMTLLSWLSSRDIDGTPTQASDIWGYTSPAGREYAIIGLRKGTSFVDITDPLEPRVVGTVPGPSSLWRDMATLGPWAYSVNERSDGIQVIDLRRIDEGRVRLARTVTANGLRTSHNIFVNEDSGYAYLLGSNLSRGGIVAADLSNPARPRPEPVMWDVTYVHDIEVVSYDRGRYKGREIAFAFTGPEGLHIVDVTDKTAPRTLSHLRYENATYGHSGALSPNRKLLYVNDELDERQGATPSMTTYIIRVGNLEKPRLVRRRRWGISAIDHNSMIQGDRLFVSAYEGGLRMIDIRRPVKPRMRGHVDTHPDSEATRFTGAWGVYAGFPSGIVAVSDIERGLFLIQPR